MIYDIAKFRELLRTIKEGITENIVFKSQNPELLNKVKAELKHEFIKLRDLIRNGDNYPESMKEEMMYYLRRDLLLFPYTPDPIRIDDLPDTNGEKNSTEEVE
jgi:hypothetical protein